MLGKREIVLEVDIDKMKSGEQDRRMYINRDCVVGSEMIINGA